MLGRMFTPLLLSLAALAPTSDDAPDLVTLTEGKALEGRVLYEDDARVVVRVKRRERELPREEVAELQTIERSLRAYLDAYDRTPHDDTAALAGLGASQAAAMHAPARPHWDWRNMIGMPGVGARLQGFLQGQHVPAPLPGFGGDIAPGVMRPAVPGFVSETMQHLG